MEDLGLIDGYDNLKEGYKKLSNEINSNEEVDLYDIILEYLVQGGYADTLGSAEIILENMSEDWMEQILDEAREEGVKPYRPGPSLRQINRQAKRAEQRRKGKDAEKSGWKDRSHIKAEGPLITAKPGDKEEARKALKQTLPDGKRIMGPGFYSSRPADRVASITSSFTRGDMPGGGDPKATRLPREEAPKARRVIPSRLDRKK
ncbi:MAG: hypothetical protein EBR67_07670 [Proteobacteria bacterium]|nr:hypothetical protein [Pseudomonadota bacterium]